MTDVRRPLRLWPGIVLAVAAALARFVLPAVVPDSLMYSVLGGFFAAVLVPLWWLFFSRAAWVERLGAIAVMVLGVFGAKFIVDVSIATGAMGYLMYFLVLPILSIAFVAWAVATRNLSDGVRRATMAATIVAVCGGMALIRTGGFNGSFQNDLHFRWTKSAEDRLVEAAAEPTAPAPPPVTPAAVPEKPAAIPTPPAAATAAPVAAEAPKVEKVYPSAEWPGFRGPHRDGSVAGVRIKTDWAASPPVKMWQRTVGPGWSSFAVQGNLIYTQEQRGPNEVVSCYELKTGKPVWTHRDAARFYESNGGPGPRGTPELSNGRVYTLGGTGIVNALNASTGAVIWSRNGAAETEMKTPDWGFAGSPVVVDDAVLVAVSGRLAAYDAATGAPRWKGPARHTSYSSPHVATIGGVKQVLLLSADGLSSFAPADGKLLWEHAWNGYPIVQPALTPDGDVLISVTDSSGLRRLAATQSADGWKVEERWTTNGLKPYFNDFVVHNGYAFGFDGSILSCIDLKDGQRKWKGGRYGNGQMVLLADEDVLLVAAESGEVALVSATPDQFKELGRFTAIEGKTWNHPVVVRDVLLVRNGEQMAAFRLASAGL